MSINGIITKLTTLPLVEEITPVPDLWKSCQRLAHLPNILFLDSAGGPRHLCRYSYLTADPFLWVESRGRKVLITDRTDDGQAVRRFPPTRSESEILQSSSPVFREGIEHNANPFHELSKLLERYTTSTIPGLPPFQGGAAGLFGYDLCHHIEKLPRPKCDEFQVPDMALGFYDWVIAFDHHRERAWLISTGFPETTELTKAFRAQERADFIRSLITRKRSNKSVWKLDANPISPVDQYEVPELPGLFSNFTRARYLDTIARAVEYVHAGDCFQVNVAQRLLHRVKISPMDLYGRLRSRNPAPFAGYFDLGDFVIASASPERFLQLQNGHVETRPIKGTRPRGASLQEDQANRTELLGSEKDRAENVMIVDLLRNDLGRVCQYGSVQVSEVCRLESYEYVHHLVSEVRGQLRDGLGSVDLLTAAFPGGSVTGAPKVRAMEIITELEQTARGSYCGSLGYIGFDGNMDTNILIRTFTVGGGWIQFPVGGGIVADSVPEKEYEETWHKAKGSMEALTPEPK
ncbi:MAG: aminodeoxychorismate synthase component I [Gemmataceae bacterium]